MRSWELEGRGEGRGPRKSSSTRAEPRDSKLLSRKGMAQGSAERWGQAKSLRAGVVSMKKGCCVFSDRVGGGVKIYACVYVSMSVTQRTKNLK